MALEPSVFGADAEFNLVRRKDHTEFVEGGRHQGS
jgi:hypothetical protein